MQYAALPHQMQALTSRKPLIFMGGGVGCGKTDVGSLWALEHVQATPPGVVGCIVANSYGQLFDSTLANVYKNWRSWGVQVDPYDKPRQRGPVSLRVAGVEVLCRSLENYELLAGTEFGWVWMDEAFQARREAFEVVLARLRDTRMPASHRQLLLTTTLDDPGSWMHEFFVERHDPARMEVLYARTTDNPFLPPGYADTLRASYSKALYERMCLSQWVALDGFGIYHSFSRDANVSPGVAFDPARPILWSHDFNLAPGKPMSSVLAQMHRGDHGPELHCFDEIVIETADTNDVVQEFKGREWGRLAEAGVIVYGDASGRARDTRSKTTDYDILATAGFRAQKVPRSNPPIRTRHNVVNGLLCSAAGHVRIRIHPRCATLIRGLERARLKNGSQYVEDDSLSEQHITTALGYLCCEEFGMPLERPS